MSNYSVLQASPKVSHVVSGISQRDRSELAAELSVALANTFVLYMKTLNFHWNVVGPMFYNLHKLTEEQYKEMAEAIDTIAERVRAIGFPTPGTLQRYLELASIEEESGAPSAEDMIEQLINDHETCARILRKIVGDAEGADDLRTADMLTARIGQHEEHAWMLRSMIS